MAKNRKFKKSGKKYSVEEKLSYHSARANDNTLSEGKQIYSAFWVSGYQDPRAPENYPVACRHSCRSGRCRMERISDSGFKNGLKANLDTNNYRRR